jgi:serine/threonine protein kinase
MEPRTWDRIQEIYYSALDIPSRQRCDFVTRACDFDPVLAKQICSLLKADSCPEFLEAPIFGLGLRILNDDVPTELSETSDAAIDELIGSIIDGRFMVESLLAEGGMARVYLATDLRLQPRRVVVKVLLDKSLRNERVLRKFVHEREALASVNHPGVVQILDAGKLDDQKPYIVMQYVEGVSSRDVIAANPEGVEFDRAASIIKGIGGALNAVHEQEIYHRDLKPENIMLERSGSADEHVMIVDFGIAKVTGSVLAPSTMTGAGIMGTIAYMSPEQLRGDSVTAASDLYSFAVVAYEMLTGRRPFVADTEAHLRELQRKGVRVKPVDLRPRLPVKAQNIILRALAFDANDRGSGAKEFGDSLARALFQPKPPTRTQNLWPSRWLVFVGVAVMIFAVGTAAYWLASRGALLGTPANSRSTSSSPHRTLAYSLTVQKMRDGLPYKDPFESSGDATFENGDKFRLNVSSRQAGYLYVFSQGTAERETFTIIYPTPAKNEGSARLEQNQDLQTNWNVFGGEPGTERLWIVWSSAVVTPLEIARYEAFKNNEGAITDASVAKSLRDFLSEHLNPAPETTKDTAKQRTSVRVNGDLMVKLLELEHR